MRRREIESPNSQKMYMSAIDIAKILYTFNSLSVSSLSGSYKEQNTTVNNERQSEQSDYVRQRRQEDDVRLGRQLWLRRGRCRCRQRR